MEIIVHTEEHEALLNEFKAKIDDNTIRTWFITTTTNGKRYRHGPGQWDKVRIKAEKHTLGLRFIPTQLVIDEEDAIPRHGYVIGRLVEVLLNHLSDYYDHLEIHS